MKTVPEQRRKKGDVREDGYIFRGYARSNGRVYEQWASPEVFAKRREYAREWARSNAGVNREKRREYSREYMMKARRARPEVYMLTRIRQRAKDRGLEFNLCLEDIVIPPTCPVLGIQLQIGEGIATDNSPELDRIDNSKGYVKGNVIVVSRRANRIKNDATADELMKIAKFYKQATRHLTLK